MTKEELWSARKDFSTDTLKKNIRGVTLKQGFQIAREEFEYVTQKTGLGELDMAFIRDLAEQLGLNDGDATRLSYGNIF